MTYLEKEIADRLEIMGTYYDLDALLKDKTDNKAVAKYYRKSDFFYNLINSRGGFHLHMGLSDDVFFHKEDFLKQAQFVETLIDKPVMNILEIGAGRLPNTKYLAKKFPQHSFTALDIPNRNFLKNKVPGNVKLLEGDYHDLSVFPENNFDIVFGVETLSYSANKERVTKEIARVLKPGGKVVFFDIYDAKPQEEMTDFEKRVSAITLASMRITPKDQYIGNLGKYLARNGFKDVEITDLTHAIRPSLRRLDRICCYYFMHPKFMKFIRHFVSQDADNNAIGGWLMFLTFDAENFHQYNRTVATKI
jgi:ubiquinone/menaquinone biosynthesis C-methylase UbiE